MASPELQIHVHALSYLVTILFQRMHESDPVWTRELLEGIKADRRAVQTGTPQADLADKVFQKAIKIVEEAISSGNSTI